MGEVKEVFTQSVVTCDDQASFAADKCMKYPKGGNTSISVALEVEGSNIVTFA